MLELTASHRADQQTPAALVWGAYIRNASDLPILDVRVSFYYIQEKRTSQAFEFTDAAGNRWERDPRGTLVPRS
jgi:hypothetical protein